MSTIFSPGKLLLTSEYVVLDGALALAVATKPGQEFLCTEITDGKSQVIWKAYHQGQLWLNICLNYKTWEISETNLPESADFVVKILKEIQKLSSGKLHSGGSYHIVTNLQFPADFGLGSSSTLMNNLALWADIDAFLLNDLVLGGSGYDIAVAKEKSAVLFQLKNNERNVRKISFEPPFKEDIIFIHLNQKKDSREAIRHYRSKDKPHHLIEEFSRITDEVINCSTLENFTNLMIFHEKKLSEFLEIPPIKETYFKDCPSFVKSLGGWGGDFVMASRFDNYQQWFEERGFSTVFSWDNIII